MKKKLISICLLTAFICAFYILTNKYECVDSSEQEMVLQKVFGLDIGEKTKEFKETKINDMIFSLKENNTIEKYYGTYEITEFWPTLSYYKGYRWDFLMKQEADMMLGHIVEIQEDSLVTYECFRWNRVYRGRRVAWSGNYQIEKVLIENPQYKWEIVDSASVSLEEFAGRLRESFPCAAEFEDCREKICGRITVTVEEPYVQEYYVMEDGIIMHSTMAGEYFYLKKLDKEPDKAMITNTLSEEKKEEIKEKVYGNYMITKFLPTKFYPALDVAGDILLPQEEADMMIGKEVVVKKEMFTTYSNNRLPNSQIMNRSMEEYLLEKIEIPTPDYQIEMRLRDDIYGLRDEMLPEEMIQEEYLEISVYPGYEKSVFDEVLPQMYLLNDGRLLLYAMGEYFLLEKVED